ncbi:MAG: sugar phosphate isomerase/epimerase [Bryobacteraceae bacterium]|nr:sugar phosphate isomerase/epimerase [Bryobacteraceae bacterium]
MERRQFLGLALSTAAAPLAARTLPTIGVQLYTLRTVLPKKADETLKALEEMGFREAEVIGGQMDITWPALEKTKIKPVSLHLDTRLFTADKGQLPGKLEDAAKRGFEYVVCPYIAPQDRGGPEVMKRLGDTLNEAGTACEKIGLKLAYHNHAFEFEPAAGGGTLLDVLLKEADPNLVFLELDVMWVQVAGLTPADIIAKYGRRTHLMHLKNVASMEKRYNEQVPRESFREVGDGVIDMAATLRAAAKAGVKHYFVEQDHTPGDPLESLRKSIGYLKKLDY